MLRLNREEITNDDVDTTTAVAHASSRAAADLGLQAALAKVVHRRLLDELDAHHLMPRRRQVREVETLATQRQKHAAAGTGQQAVGEAS